jgi:lipopolysaccharide export system protein LptC
VKLSTTRVFPLALMFALALLTFYLERAVREDDSPSALRRHDPDYFVANFTTTTYNKDGAPESILSAKKMMHFPDDDSTDLTAPRVVQSKPREPRVIVTAERGTLSRSGEEIFLYDNVELVREAAGERPEARMTTSFLHVVPDKDLVSTDREVTLTHGNSTVKSVGLEFNNKTRQLKLLSNVKGQLQTPQKDGRPALPFGRKH